MAKYCYVMPRLKQTIFFFSVCPDKDKPQLSCIVLEKMQEYNQHGSFSPPVHFSPLSLPDALACRAIIIKNEKVIHSGESVRWMAGGGALESD